MRSRAQVFEEAAATLEELGYSLPFQLFPRLLPNFEYHLIQLPDGNVALVTKEKEGIMAYTNHGHHIPGTIAASVAEQPKSVARCGGPVFCSKCKEEAREYRHKVGEVTDFQEKAKLMVRDYVDSMQKQNFPDTEAPLYEVYVESFTKTLQNWKARLGTTMPDGYMFELTYDGDSAVTYFDAYKKMDNIPIFDRPRA